jgi:hypothetical protein
MPKWEGMTQISRPFVIALGAVVLFAAVWFVGLRPHASNPETPASTPAPAPAVSGAAEEKANAAPSHVDHTSTPGLEGLTKDINRAHGAVAASQANGRRVEEKAAQASGGASAGTATTSSAQQSPAPKSATTPTATAPSASTVHKTSTAPASVHSATAAAAAQRAKSERSKPANEPTKAHSGKQTMTGIPEHQALVESALKDDKTAVILFWNPRSAEDQVVHLSVALIAAVHEILESLQPNPKVEDRGAAAPITVFEAAPNQVASFGSFTRSVQVLQTPTILIVNPLGQVTTIPGYTETRAINQRIGESRKAFEVKADKHAAG